MPVDHLGLDLEADDEEEQRHAQVVDDVLQALGDGEAPDADGRVGACVTFTLPLSSPHKTSTDGPIAERTEAMIAQMEEPLLAAVVHK